MDFLFWKGFIETFPIYFGGSGSHQWPLEQLHSSVSAACTSSAPDIAVQAEDVKPDVAAAVPPGTRGVGKDPTVPTGFLPDRERERREEDLRHQLKTEFQLRQQVVIASPKKRICKRGAKLHCPDHEHAQLSQVSHATTDPQVGKGCWHQLKTDFQLWQQVASTHSAQHARPCKAVGRASVLESCCSKPTGAQSAPGCGGRRSTAAPGLWQPECRPSGLS